MYRLCLSVYRPYVGPTTLDHTLALIIANITQICSNQIVYDPFVGTASLLIAASHFGAICIGGDIDIRVLRGDMFAGQQRSGSLGGNRNKQGHTTSDPHNNSNNSEAGVDVVTSVADETKRDVFSTFKGYGLPRPELIRMVRTCRHS